MEKHRIQNDETAMGCTAEEFRGHLAEARLLLTEGEEPLTDEKALEKIEGYVFSMKRAQQSSHRQNLRLVERLFLSLRKEMDILQPLIDDKSISEIMVNGKDDIFVERRGRLERVPLAFDTTEDLEDLIRRIAAKVHREINELNPIVVYDTLKIPEKSVRNPWNHRGKIRKKSGTY